MTLTSSGQSREFNTEKARGKSKPECRPGAQKFKPGAFQLQNYWILPPEPTFLGPASYSNPTS